MIDICAAEGRFTPTIRNQAEFDEITAEFDEIKWYYLTGVPFSIRHVDATHNGATPYHTGARYNPTYGEIMFADNTVLSMTDPNWHTGFPNNHITLGWGTDYAQ